MRHAQTFTVRSQALRAASLVLLAAMTAVAHASTPEAWAKHDREVVERCVAASGFKDAKAVGKPVVFDDTVAQTALLIRGTYPQKHMAGKQGEVLCLYNRKIRRASVQEWTPEIVK